MNDITFSHIKQLIMSLLFSFEQFIDKFVDDWYWCRLLVKFLIVGFIFFVFYYILPRVVTLVGQLMNRLDELFKGSRPKS